MNKKILLAFSILMIICATSLASSEVAAARYLLSREELKDVYYQNEKIEIVAVIMNNDTAELEIKSLHILVESSKIIGRNSTIYINMSVPINESISKGQAYTVYYELELRSLLPDTYNLTVTLEMRFFAETYQKVPIIEDWKFQVKPYIEVPPAAIVVLLTMIAVIIVFIGYGIAGRIGGRKRK